MATTNVNMLEATNKQGDFTIHHDPKKATVLTESQSIHVLRWTRPKSNLGNKDKILKMLILFVQIW